MAKKQPHYTTNEKQDVISFCYNNGLDFMQGNAIKYIARFKKKNGLEDLQKAEDYIRRMKALYYGEHEDPEETLP